MQNIFARAKTYDDAVERFKTHRGDLEYKEKFHNGLTISIIRNSFSYGGKSGLFEVAFIGIDGEMLYIPSEGGSVIGWCTADKVVELALAVWSVGR